MERNNLFLNIYRIIYLRKLIFKYIKEIGKLSTNKSYNYNYIKEKNSLTVTINFGSVSIFKSIIETNKDLLIRASDLAQLNHDSSGVHKDGLSSFDIFISQILNTTMIKRQYKITEYLLDRFPNIRTTTPPDNALLEDGQIDLLKKYKSIYKKPVPKESDHSLYDSSYTQINLDDLQSSILPYALLIGNLELAKYLVDNYFDVHSKSVIRRFYYDMEGENRFEIFKYYHQQGLVDLKESDQHLRSALDSRNLPLVRYMLENNFIHTLIQESTIESLLLFGDNDMIKMVTEKFIPYDHGMRAKTILKRPSLDLDLFLFFHKRFPNLFVNNAELLLFLVESAESTEVLYYILDNLSQFIVEKDRNIILSVDKIKKNTLSLDLVKRFNELITNGKLLFNNSHILGESIFYGFEDIVDYLLDSNNNNNFKIDYTFALECAINIGSLKLSLHLTLNYHTLIKSIPKPKSELPKGVDLDTYLEIYEAIGKTRKLRMSVFVLVGTHYPILQNVVQILHRNQCIEFNITSYYIEMIFRYAVDSKPPTTTEWLRYLLALPLRLPPSFSLYSTNIDVEKLEILMESGLYRAENMILSFITAGNYLATAYLINHLQYVNPLTLRRHYEAAFSRGYLDIAQLYFERFEDTIRQNVPTVTRFHDIHPKILPFLEKEKVIDLKTIPISYLISNGLRNKYIDDLRWLFDVALKLDLKIQTLSRNDLYYIYENNIIEGIEYIDRNQFLFNLNQSYSIQLLSILLKSGHINSILKIVNYLENHLYY